MNANIEGDLDELKDALRRLAEASTEGMSAHDLAEHERLLEDTRQRLEGLVELSRCYEEAMYMSQELGFADQADLSPEENMQLLDYELMVLTYAQFTRWEQYCHFTDRLIDTIGANGYESLTLEEMLYLDTFAARLRLGKLPA